MPITPQRARLRPSRIEPISDVLPFLLREDEACRRMLERYMNASAASTLARGRFAQEICFTLAANAQMEEEPYYRALRADRDTSISFRS